MPHIPMIAADQIILLPRPRTIRALAGGAIKLPAQPTVTIEPGSGLRPQGYRLSVAPAGTSIQAADEAGAFYGRMTLRQLARQCGDSVPACEIEDWPDFPVRGVMLDISRDKVPTMDTLFALVDELAEWKINHLELYTEHTFAYRNHQRVWKDASPMTAAEIRQLDAYCRERFVELVPNQNSFGHFERWLEHSEYHHLAECPDGFEWPWGRRPAGSTLSPAVPESIALIADLYAELLPNFTSRKFNVGCDETWELGRGRSEAACAERGKGMVYLEFVLKIYELVKRHGHTMHLWGDIIIEHPELVAQLPKDVVVLEWGYEAAHPFEEHSKLFAKTGLSFYVCPGTSAWNTIAGRTENAIANLLNAATHGLRHGATGYLNTDWGDSGHLQYLPVSYLGFAVGAALSWCLETNRDAAQYAAALDAHAFHDHAGVMGKLAVDLGNAYLHADCPLPNSNVLFHLLLHPTTATVFEAVEPAKIEATRAFIEKTIQRLGDARMDRPDAELIKAEFANAARMMIYACNRALKIDNQTLAQDLTEILREHRRLWLARNRPGGLKDSPRILEKQLAEYAAEKSNP